jgi:hypothetical protein
MGKGIDNTEKGAIMRYRGMLVLAALSIILVAGCSPVSTGVKLGVKVVGKVVDDEETKKLSQQLVGQPPSAADQLLGPRVNVLHDANGSRTWLAYGVKMDPLKSSRYVVVVRGNRIVLVQKVGKESDEVGIARGLYYLAKVKGKTPAEATSILGMGAPIMVLRSETTGQLCHLYDSRMVEGLGSEAYCVARFDKGVCTAVDMVKVKASDGQK